MALTLAKSLPDPRDPANSLPGAYAWLSFLALDLRGGKGRITFDVHPAESAWEGQPVTQISAELGQGVGAARFASLADLMADPEFASAYAIIGAKLYGSAVAALPQFEGATQA